MQWKAHVHSIARRTADEAWRDVTALLIESGLSAAQGSRGGDTLELLHVGLRLRDTTQRWVVSRTPALNPAFALVEVFWIAGGRGDAALPTHWNPALPRYCGATSTYHGAYGHRLRKHFGIDQLDRVYRALMSAPDSRQCVLQLWDSRVDLPQLNGEPAALDIPCNVVAMPKVRAGKLEWMQVIRSNDVFLGLPHNIVQFTALQEMLAGWLGIVAGDYCQLSDSLHIYSHDVERGRASLEPLASPDSTDSFAISRADWDEVLPDVLGRLDGLAKSDISPSAFKTLAFAADVPVAYNNSVLIAAADAARRLGWHDVAHDCVDACTNPALVGLWSRWRARAEAERGRSRSGADGLHSVTGP